MDKQKELKNLSRNFSPEKLISFFRQSVTKFRLQAEDFGYLLDEEAPLDALNLIGTANFDDVERMVFVLGHSPKELTSRSGKLKQYALAKKILEEQDVDGGIFVYYDDGGHFRFSLVLTQYQGRKRRYTNFRRYTYFISPDLPNKTFITQISKADFSGIDKILEAFSIEAVSNDFYKDFQPKFDRIIASIQGSSEQRIKDDFSLLFVIRIIFLGFVQKKGWLGTSPRFLQDFWSEYKKGDREVNTFYTDWLEPLFFEALNAPPGRKIAYRNNKFSAETAQILQMSPYLNGELFKRKRGIDDQGFLVPDEEIEAFFDFLFQYNFTVEENELYDEELELNPEFLGIIFERLTNKDQGAVYTPRIEVDFMCRLGLVKWLEQNTKIDQKDLYRLFFREMGSGKSDDDVQKQGDFSPAEIRTLIQHLEDVTVCDPAAGSGAFEVGMLQVLSQTLDNLYTRNNTPAALKENAPSSFARKKAIIANSLYGVEVKRWAVWINHLRLWLSLFVDMPDDTDTDKANFRYSQLPLLPNLTFKVRAGDSLVQRIGNQTFPVQGYSTLSSALKVKIARLKKRKYEFFYNKSSDYRLIEQEELQIFRTILDEEIEQKRKKLQQTFSPQYKQTGFGGAFDTQMTKQQEMDLVALTKKDRERLQREIAELQAQKDSLKEERPFIWSIEFSEIFFDERGGFDVLIGNPPYVNKESMADPNKRLSSKEYKDALLSTTRSDFPDYFAKARDRLDIFKKGRKPSGRSDLYTYFYIRSLRLLNPDGIHLFICSNSWLDVGYGAWLQEFLLRNVPIHFIIDNHARRSFANADVNTIISVLGAPIPSQAKAQQVLSEHRVKFVAFKRPFDEVIYSENLLTIESAKEIVKADDFRVYPISTTDLLVEGSDNSGKYTGDKWGGKYLRAPDVFFTVLQKSSVIALAQVAKVSGYVHDNNTGRNYKKVPFIKSIKDIRQIALTSQHTYLYGVKENGSSTEVADLLFARTFGEDHLVLLNTTKAVGKEFYRIFARDVDATSLSLLLNATFSILQRELFGLTNLGGGAIKFSADDVRRFLIPKSLVDGVPYSGTKQFISRQIQSVFIECGIDPKSDTPIAEQEPRPLPDRKELDDIVFNALDLNDEERKEVYRAVCQLVWNRISKAKSK